MTKGPLSVAELLSRAVHHDGDAGNRLDESLQDVLPPGKAREIVVVALILRSLSMGKAPLSEHLIL